MRRHGGLPRGEPAAAVEAQGRRVLRADQGVALQHVDTPRRREAPAEPPPAHLRPRLAGPRVPRGGGAARQGGRLGARLPARRARRRQAAAAPARNGAVRRSDEARRGQRRVRGIFGADRRRAARRRRRVPHRLPHARRRQADAGAHVGDQSVGRVGVNGVGVARGQGRAEAEAAAGEAEAEGDAEERDGRPGRRAVGADAARRAQPRAGLPRAVVAAAARA